MALAAVSRQVTKLVLAVETPEARILFYTI